MTTAKELLDARLATAKARLAAAKSAFTDEDREARALRTEIAQREAEAEEAEREKLAEDLEVRLELARAENPGKTFRAVMMKTFPDTFIVFRNGKAHAAWTDAITRAVQASAQGKNIDRAPINREYALRCTFDWNGQQDFDTNTDLSDRLRKYLDVNPGLLTPLTDAAGELAGVFADERAKSA